MFLDNQPQEQTQKNNTEIIERQMIIETVAGLLNTNTFIIIMENLSKFKFFFIISHQLNHIFMNNLILMLEPQHTRMKI